MAKVLVTDTHLTDIASAIRNKNGTSDTYKPSEMANAIESIETGGGEAVLQEKKIAPTTSSQIITPDEDYDGLSKVTIEAVTNEIDNNITSSNIKSGVSILGIEGTLEEGITPSGELEITENGSYDVTEYASANVNVESSGSQKEYERVGYIQFTGDQTIDTGIICNRDTEIRILFTRESSSAQYMYGVASSDNKATVTAYLSSGGAWRFGDKSASTSITVNENLVNCAIVNKTGIIRVGTTQSFSGTSNFETVGSLTIGSCRNPSGTLGTPQFIGKIYSFEMWQGEEQVLKLIPMVNKDGVYGFWDAISETFLTSITDIALEGEV